MPPRGSRGGARGARPARGARGRGAAAAAADATGNEEGAASGEGAQTSHEDGDSTMPDAPSANASTAAAAPAAQPAPAPAARESATPAPSGAPRFKPKAVRRDASERQRLEDERQRQLTAKIKVEEREQRDADRRARRGGRGGAARGGLVRRAVVGMGPFSGVPNESVRLGGGSGSGSGSGSGQGSSSRGTKSEFSHQYEDRRANETRLNIDHMMRGNAMFGEGRDEPKSGSPLTLPVGITRVEHKEEEAKVATSAELEAEEQEDDDNLFVGSPTSNLREVGMTDDNEVWHAAPKKATEAKVKPEPGTEEDAMDIDSIPAAPPLKEPLSPEQKKKPAADLDAEAGEKEKAIDLDAETKEKEKAKEKKRERALQDFETLAIAEDRKFLVEELSLEKNKDSLLYLFQFPFKLPPLEDAGTLSDEAVSEHQQTNGTRAKAGAGAAAPEHSTMPPTGGFVGKMNVRKSGKVELDWGGFLFTLGAGTQTSFPSSVMLLQEQENDLVSGAAKATGMGPLYGRFVLAPNWGEEEDWVPDLEGLDLGN